MNDCSWFFKAHWEGFPYHNVYTVKYLRRCVFSQFSDNRPVVRLYSLFISFHIHLSFLVERLRSRMLSLMLDYWDYYAFYYKPNMKAVESFSKNILLSSTPLLFEAAILKFSSEHTYIKKGLSKNCCAENFEKSFTTEWLFLFCGYFFIISEWTGNMLCYKYNEVYLIFKIYCGCNVFKANDPFPYPLEI